MKSRPIKKRGTFEIPKGFEVIEDHASIMQKGDEIWVKYSKRWTKEMIISGFAGRPINQEFSEGEKVLRKIK